jgi:formate hydrogenlyase subunit 3/multisubunit Na+/H+ antiporter MnhD subunit
MNSSILLYPIFIPVLAGLICLLIPTKWIKESISVAVTGITLGLAISIFLRAELIFARPWLPLGGFDFTLRSYHFSSLILVFITLFGFLISLYSARFMAGKPRPREYYAYLLWTVGASSGVVLSNSLIVFLLFWGTMAVLLYSLLSLGSYRVATKGLITMGVGDFSLILGILLLYRISGTFQISEIPGIPIEGGIAASAFLLVVIGAMAKIGSVPFQRWIPVASEEVPMSVMAFLPASLDKLVGIYLLYRVSFDLFTLGANSAVSVLLMIIGSFTIVVAALMALTQSSMKRLLAYLNICAAGYLMVGLATANPVGIGGGLFYLLNTAIWTSCLFLVAGSVESQIHTTQFDETGGLVRIMPITFACCLIAGLSLSGIPPLNGFFSKWMIYQGIVEGGRAGGGNLWIIWLLAAMFGSALTLASFMKLTHATFLGTSSKPEAQDPKPQKKEAALSMLMPMVGLASLCVIFGVLAYRIPLGLFISEVIPQLPPASDWIGWWQPGVATILIILGFVVGAIIYRLSKVSVIREDDAYIGGELATPQMKVSGVDFYDTIKDFAGFKKIYGLADKGKLDFSQWGMTFSKGLAAVLLALDRVVDFVWMGLAGFFLLLGRAGGVLHTGILHSYLAWYLLGIIVLLLVFL